MVKDKKIEKIQKIDNNTNLKGGEIYSTFSSVTSFIHNHVMFLNNIL